MCAPVYPQRIEEERKGAQALRDHQSLLEDQLRDATLRNQQYEGAVYGLPQVSYCTGTVLYCTALHSTGCSTR